MRKENADFNTKFISEAGSYLINSDYFAFVELKDYACYVVADGIDTDEKKESAKLAVTTVITEFSDSPGMSAGKLRRFLKGAHEALLRESDEIRLEASIVILLTDYKKAIWGHAGNSRLCWIKNGEIKTVTKDTSLTQRMVDQEEVPMDQIAFHEERNNLYTYLGQPGRFTPVVSGKKKLEDGDIFILLTRGVWENVGDAEIIDAVDGVSKAEDVCTGLEDVILSQRLEVIENYTIASVFINKIYQNPKAGKYKNLIRIAVSILTVLLMFGLSMFLMQYNRNKSNLNKLDKYKEKGIEYLQETNYESADKQFSDAYAVTDSIKARKNSKAETKVNIIEYYNKMAENMVLGMEAMSEGEYKKASALFGQAVEKLQILKDTYQEDITSYDKGIKTYLSYAQNMYEGTEKYKQGDYEAANENFFTAKDIMDDINDTTKRDIAQKALNSTNAKKATSIGAEFEARGDQYSERKEYEKAGIEYESAKAAYGQAYEYGDADAQNKMMLAATKAENAKSLSAKRTDQERLSLANEYESKGDAAARAGKKEEAESYYKEAVDLLANISTIDVGAQKVALNEKANNSAEDPEQELLNAIDCLSRGDYASAVEALNSAKDIYNRLGNKASAQQMQTYINNVKALMTGQ